MLNVKVEKIYIYPLGGISKFNMPLNIPKYKELLILIAGPLFQFFAYYILLRIMPIKSDLIKIYHYSILSFNLLPIYPLDGGKLINILISEFFPYKLSLKISIYISYLVTLTILIINKNLTLNIIITEIFLLFLITKENRRVEYIYNKFMLERYLNGYKFKKSSIISNINNMYRDRRHLLKKGGNYYLEREILEKKYKN